MLYLERDQPEIASAARWYLEPVDYLTMRFTGRAAASHASMSGAWLTDNRRLDKLEYDPVLVGKLGLDAAKLPPLVETGSMIGIVRPEVASELGISPAAQVVTGTPDLHSAPLGCGAIGEGQAHITISTTSWISLPFPRKKTDALHSIATVPVSTRAATWSSTTTRPPVSASAGSGTASPSASRGEFERPDRAGRQLAVREWGNPVHPLDRGRALAGRRSNARGGWHNLSVQTSNADLVRSVLEGVAYNSRWLNEAVEGFAKRRLDPIRIFGGGAVSSLWCQIHADVMDRTIERVADPMHANLRGAALFAALGLGAISRDQVRDLVRVDRVFDPTRPTREAYDRLYAEFPGLYKAQRKMFAR